jgi:hypothetical protein
MPLLRPTCSQGAVKISPGAADVAEQLIPIRKGRIDGDGFFTFVLGGLRVAGLSMKEGQPVVPTDIGFLFHKDLHGAYRQGSIP